MNIPDLNTIWYILVGVLFTGYAMLDGFDLGVGILHLFVRKDEQRRMLLNSIGPVWDGNEVWLVTGGGALFAAFPGAYATVFSGFYLAFMLLLCSLIFRAVAIEFRSYSKLAGFTGLRCAYTVIPKSLQARDAAGNLHSVHALWNRRHTTKFNGVS